MFSDELETLIQISIADGVLTDQEKAVLIKKAAEEGVDINQLDIYIQYLMSQKQSEENAANMERIRSSKVGTAKKCPHCGGLVPELVDVCPHCKGLITAEADEELTEIINMFEDTLIELKSGGDIARAKANVERYVRKAKLYYENNAKVQKLLAEIEIEIETEKAEKAAKTNAIGIISKVGRYGGTYAHKDIVFEFAMWPSPRPPGRRSEDKGTSSSLRCGMSSSLPPDGRYCCRANLSCRKSRPISEVGYNIRLRTNVINLK